MKLNTRRTLVVTAEFTSEHCGTLTIKTRTDGVGTDIVRAYANDEAWDIYQKLVDVEGTVIASETVNAEQEA